MSCFVHFGKAPIAPHILFRAAKQFDFEGVINRPCGVGFAAFISQGQLLAVCEK